MKLYGTPKHFKVQERARDHCPLLPCAKFSWLQSAIAKIHYSQTLTLTVTFAKVSYSQSVSQQRLVLGLGFGSMVWLQWALAIADCNQLYLAHTHAPTHTRMGWHCLVWWGLDFACQELSQNADSNTTLVCWFTHTHYLLLAFPNVTDTACIVCRQSLWWSVHLAVSLRIVPLQQTHWCRGPIYKISYDYLMIMPKLQSTYNGRWVYNTSYGGHKADFRYDSLE